MALGLLVIFKSTIAFMSFMLLGIVSSRHIRSKKSNVHFSYLDNLATPVIVVVIEKLKIDYCNPAGLRFLLDSNVANQTDNPFVTWLFNILNTTQEFPKIFNWDSEVGAQVKIHIVVIDAKQIALVEVYPRQDAEIVRLSESLDELTYAISHDLMEPIRTIRSMIQIIQRSYPELSKNEQLISDFSYVVEGTTRLHEMINGMLSYSRLNTASFPMTEVDSMDVMVDVIKDLAASVKESKAFIECSSLPKIHFNRTLLYQIFINLVGNAIKYRKMEGPCQIFIDSVSSEDQVGFSVHDNGIGIEEEQFDRIFKIFQRLNPNDPSRLGTGLGLGLAKKIVENAKGTMGVESTIGQGSTFYFTLPQPKNL